MKLPKSLSNWTSLIGITIAIISLFMIVFLFLISTVFEEGGSYLGLLIFIVLPVFLVIGLILIPIGMLSKYKKDKKQKEVVEKRWPRIDFNDGRTRNAFMVFVVGSTIFLLMSAIGSYEAFHYTESVEFCGTICHEVMEPEYVAYQNSPHARVSCVECHVGSGADWYVRSKLSGLYQVYAVLTDKFPRPIPTPVTNLRPARETCEKCHWPEKFYARQLKLNKSFLVDYDVPEWDIKLQIKTGPMYSALGLQEGIHWHINPDIKVEYKASTPDREKIPWVKYTNLKTGESFIYEDTENPLTPAQFDSIPIREMDCMDCHNRPSHEYQTPQFFIDEVMTSGELDKHLPDIKTVAMELLYSEFPTKDSAFKAIEAGFYEYYEFMYEEVFDTARGSIDNAIKVVQDQYSKNIFPAMKVSWDKYPNHIGHLETNGCYRCHNDTHVSKTGKSISRDCNLCHLIMAQGPPDNMEVSTTFSGLEFKHPIDINQKWKTTLCSECHNRLY